MLAFIDDAATMKKIKAARVTDATDPEQNKIAIDAFANQYQPDYIMLLGAQDVIPHCRFKILIPDDDDAFVPSDTPYACDAPSRVLGRLPDITGGTDPAYLLKLIENSINWKPEKLSSYDQYFSLSVKWWEKSTRLSLNNIFGDNKTLKLAPPALNGYTKKEMAARIHFFNCHGGLRTPDFYGQPNSSSNSYPVCYNTAMLDGKIEYGTLVTAECCYGGLLYNPYQPTKIQLPISNNYLANNAIAFVGSTTAAYGPADSLGGADYITQYFLISARKGASSGRAFLEAQQRFVEKGDVKMDPTDLKTIIQFLLLGDPSLSPVEEPLKENVKTNPVVSVHNRAINDIKERKERRMKLTQKSTFINIVSDAPVKIQSSRPRGSLKKELHSILKEHAFEDGKSYTYGFRKKTNHASKAAGFPRQYRYHVFSKKKEGGIIDTVKLLVVQEIDNRITEVKEYVRR